MTKSTEQCEGCGYTEYDARIHGDHRLCKNAGNAPWEKRRERAMVKSQLMNKSIATPTHKCVYIGAMGGSYRRYDIHCSPDDPPPNLFAERISRSLDAFEPMVEALKQADLQIEYMQSKFKETGTGNSVRAQIQAALKLAGEL